MITVLVPRAAMVLALGAALALALGGLGHRWSWWGVAASFSVLRAASFAAAAVAVLALLGIVLAAVARAWPGLALAVAALLIAGFVVWLPLSLQKIARSVPPIHDITTDTERPPAFVAIIERRRGAPNPPEYGGPAVAAQQKQGYPDGNAVMEHIIRGTGREIGIGPITEIRPYETRGLRFVGPLPAPIQNHTSYVATLLAGRPEDGPAAAFVRYISSPAARGVFAETGVE